MIVVRFNDLPQPARARFLEMTRAGLNDPRLLFSDLKTNVGGLGNWLVGILAGLATLAVLNLVVDRASRLAPSHNVTDYMFLAVFVSLGMIALVGILYRFIWRSAFRDGVYVLRTAIVWAKDGTFHILPFEQLGPPELTHHHYNGGYTGSSARFGQGSPVSFRTKDAARDGLGRIMEARAYYMHLLQTRDAARLGAIDVFVECTTSGQWSQPGQAPVAPLAPVVPLVATLARGVGSLFIGAAFSAALFAILDVSLADERKEAERRWSAAAATTSVTTEPTTAPTPTVTSRVTSKARR